MHAKGEDPLWEETGHIDVMFRRYVVYQVCHLPYKPELLHIVCGVRYGFLAYAIAECDIGQIGDVAIQGHREGYLYILAAKAFVAEEIGVFLVGFPEDIGPVECRAEMKHAHIGLGDDGLQQVAAWCNGGMLLLMAGNGLLVLLVEILPVGYHHRYVVMSLHHTHFLFQFQRIGPEVIASTIGYVSPPACQQTVEVIIDDTFILLMTEQTDDAWVLFGIALTDGSGVIGGTVFAYDDLIGHMALLHQNGVECPADGTFLIVGDDDDRYHVLHHLSFFMKGRVVSRILRPMVLLVSLRNQVYFALYGWLGRGNRASLRKSSSVSFSFSSDRVSMMVL